MISLLREQEAMHRAAMRDASAARAASTDPQYRKAQANMCLEHFRQANALAHYARRLENGKAL